MAPSLTHDERVRRWSPRYERLAMGPGETAAMYATMFDIFVRHVLPAIRVPTLVLHRRGDRHVRVGHGRYLAGHIPAAKYVELRGEDNLSHVGDTETMLGEIEEFLPGASWLPCCSRTSWARPSALPHSVTPVGGTSSTGITRS